MSREKRPGFDHHKKAGAMNALVELSSLHACLNLNVIFFFILLIGKVVFVNVFRFGCQQ